MYNRDIIIGSTSGKGDKTLIKLGEYNKLIVKRETNLDISSAKKDQIQTMTFYYITDFLINKK